MEYWIDVGIKMRLYGGVQRKIIERRIIWRRE
jgi:hypothetical protein